jgi:hypothetical protein
VNGEHAIRGAETHFEDVPPVLALVVESLVEHLHDLDKVVPAAS